MSRVANSFWAVRSLRCLMMMSLLVLLSQSPALALQNVLLSWNPSMVTGVAGYKIYSGGASGVYTNVIDAGTATNVTIAGLADGSTNYFSATTYDAATNESAYSVEVSFVAPAATPVVTSNPPVILTPPSIPGVLNVVGNLAVSVNATTTNSAILSWSPNADAGVVGYQIFYGTASGKYSLVQNVGLVSSLTFSGLATGTTNFFVVREFNAAWSESPMSAEFMWVMPAPAIQTAAAVAPVLNAVNNLAVTANPGVTNSVVLSWNASADAGVVGYQVFCGTASGNYTNVQVVGLVNSLVFTGLVPGATNFFAVTEFDSGSNESPISAEATWINPVPVIAPPALSSVTNLTVMANPTNANSVILSWTASLDTGVAGYKIYYGPGSQNYTSVIDAGLTTNLTVFGLASGSTNYFAATEYDAATNESTYYSSEVSFAVPMPVVLNAVGGLVVSTNPAAANSVILTWNASGDVGVAGYQVFRGGASGNYTNVQTVGLVNSLVINGLVQNSMNYFAVREFDLALDVSPISAEASWHAPVVVNQRPTLNVLSNLALNINSPLVTVVLGGITAGATWEKQTLKVTAVSSNPGLIPTPKVTYSSPKTNGVLTFTPVANQTGSAIITVTVNDGGTSNNLFTQSFTVTVVNPTVIANMPKIASQFKGGTALLGKSLTMSVAVNGHAPFKYQWMFNNIVIPGATSPTLLIKTIKPLHTGKYWVKVSNSYGSTNTALAQLTVITNPIPTISIPVRSNGQFSFQVTGVSGANYAVAATTDMKAWTPVQTNTAPFTFTETNAVSYSQRFYRTYYVP